MPDPTRQDSYLVLAEVDGRPLGEWDTYSGGEVDSEESKYRPGGGGEISLGGKRTIGNITISRYYDLLRDHPLYKWLEQVAGEVRGAVSWTPRNLRGQIAGDTVWKGGTFKRVEHSDMESDGGTDAAMLELEFTIDSMG